MDNSVSNPLLVHVIVLYLGDGSNVPTEAFTDEGEAGARLQELRNLFRKGYFAVHVKQIRLEPFDITDYVSHLINAR